MNFKTTIVLLVLLIGAGIFLLVDKWHGSSTSSQQTAEDKTKLFDVAAADIDSLQLVPGPDLHRVTVSLTKTGGDWEMTEPLPAKADKFKVDELLQQILDLRTTSSLDDAASEGASKGLNPPRLTVIFTAPQRDKEGNIVNDKAGQPVEKTYKLSVGNRSALGDMMYVQPQGARKIDVVPADAYDSLLQPADAYRDTQLITASSGDICHVEIDRPEGKLVLNKLGGNGDRWEITSPQIMPADSSQVTDLLAAITGLRAASWVEKGSPEAVAANVDHPQLTVRFSSSIPATMSVPATGASSSTMQEASEVTIKFGHYEDVLHQAVFASVSTCPYLVKVSAMRLQTFQQPALDFRDRNVLDINPAEVSRLIVDVESPTIGPATEPLAHASAHPTTAAGKTSAAARRQTIIVERAPGANELPPLIAARGYRPDSATAQAAQKRMDAYKIPAELHPPQWVIVSQPNGIANASRITSLLDKLHPLYVEHYLATSPATQPATQPALTLYVLHVTTQAAGGAAAREYDLRLTDRGPAEQALGEYNGLTFELSHSMVNALEGDFTQAPKTETPPNGLGAEEGSPGGPGGGPPPDFAR